MTVAVAGAMLEYISNIEFSLNFEEPKKLSTRVRVGDIVFFDGVMAKHIDKKTGLEKFGKAVPLKSAIQNNWLSLIGDKNPISINVKTDNIRKNDFISQESPDYNTLTGGSFDVFLKKSNIASSIIREEDQIVKKTEFTAENKKHKSDKLEVAGDQINVKTVSSSTVTPIMTKTAKKTVIRSDDGHADRIISKIKRDAPAKVEKPKNSFVVDGTTPKLSEDATAKEVQRATGTVQFDDTQDARVIGKVGAPRMDPEPNEVEGIVLKKTGNEAQKGSTPVMDLSGVKTQVEVNHMEAGLDKREISKISKDYISMLPDDWATLHWVKKEQFIKQITDPDFLKFILKVESLKAVQNACKKRLEELTK